ncbi:iron-containing alcohol dehydrogenase [Clostridium botulinum]|uniref:Iron-containing alcohol dehydrogenase n=1 Tax=Clostridium botulinum TaxID=1491 RepID=A0A0L9Y5Z7_CLOBO|nr:MULTISPECIES: iron-containing alcohol dehydrogenase [Clostridium]KAI3349812.1 iron-containing alcohol dehydrogenase [Clostridium botulinum]KOM87227.1 alcohol dehydrogenase [Clostridium botulinum]KOR57288.1 alcohol dehydrogenase [Clostridium botulinum]MBY6915221.1 iron-containing alcohol dehydrogenase [Clostridium botulinum]MBY7025579.1 iron-containing alcohol dehydrogenase [Clostridium botulinum]
MNFKLEQKVKVIVCHELANTILQILNMEKYKKPMVAIDSFLVNTPIIQGMFALLKENSLDYFVYDKIVSNPPTDIIDDGAKLFLKNNCDSIIGIGGGSAIDSARGINIVRTLGGNIRDYAFEKDIPEFCKGLIAVPTTSGTGSELSNALIVSEPKTHEKLSVLSNNAVSEYAVLVPELAITLPKSMTAATGLDAFSHAAEGYTSKLSSPITDAICEKIMYLIVQYLPKVIKNGDDIEARERIMVAAALGGWMLNNAGTHVGHSQAHIIGALYGIPHGMACAYALPGTLLYTAKANPKKVKEIGLILGAEYPANSTDLEIGEITAEKLKWFRDEVIGLDSFKKFNVSREELISNAEKVVEERFAGNSPMEITINLAEKLLEFYE